MLQMRARAWALRDVFPDVLKGVHIAEEAQDMPPERVVTGVEIMPAAGASRTASIKAKLAARSASPPTPTEEGPDLAMVLTLIADAGTPEELHGAGEMARRLISDTDKGQARQAYAARAAKMKQEAEDAEEARLEREAIQAEG
jgi:hypothetical protein